MHYKMTYLVSLFAGLLLSSFAAHADLETLKAAVKNLEASKEASSLPSEADFNIISASIPKERIPLIREMHEAWLKCADETNLSECMESGLPVAIGIGNDLISGQGTRTPTDFSKYPAKNNPLPAGVKTTDKLPPLPVGAAKKSDANPVKTVPPNDPNQ